ncbi:MAG: hypothetical protein Q9164_002956 [Protoblastenia rupestris]
MLQTRPSSSDAFQNASQGQQQYRSTQVPRNIYNTSVGGMGTGNYRGHTSASPVAPYNFSGTPTMQSTANPLRQHPTTMSHPRLETRTLSAPSIPMVQPQSPGPSSRQRPPPSNNVSTSSNPNSSLNPLQHTTSMDDLSSPKQASSRSLATLDLNPPSMQAASYANVAKSSPDRYRRNHRRAETAGGLNSNPPQSGSTMPSGSGMASVGHLYTHPNQTSSTPTLSTYPSYRGTPPNAQPSHEPDFNQQTRPASKDDLNVQRQSSSELAKRYRRRSISSLEAKEYALPPSEVPPQTGKPKSYAAMLASPPPTERKENRGPTVYERPTSAHGRQESNESANSASSGSKSFSMKRNPDMASAASTAQQATPIAKNEAKVVVVPPRGSSEASKRLGNPSPLSKPISMGSEPPLNKGGSGTSDPPRGGAPSLAPVPSAHAGMPESPAAQQLAALNKKESKKEGKPSRLRRAFSFGSAAELRKASAENNAAVTRERNKLQKSQYADDEEAQQAAIAQQQEASGLGEGIYSGQGHFFTGSTDNLSISSTASSASVMIRKMGKGMKKGSRSLVGLFRPKSVVGVPAADSAVPEPSMAQVSMVTVEAEREKVNVNANPHDQAGGGTGFPKLERNSMDAASIAQDYSNPTLVERDGSFRRSIVGGERERAEVLAAVKKGILKRTDSGNSSPQARPVDAKAPNFNLPHIPRVNDSPHSSAPSTPADERPPREHGKTDSVHIEGEEYFLSIQNYANGQSASMPGTPRGMARNISFSPRIQFHDTWPSGEYDRRGEIATCNRLTPMLAQQIKEELNTFKMEMEVHVESKINTHFF